MQFADGMMRMQRFTPTRNLVQLLLTSRNDFLKELQLFSILLGGLITAARVKFYMKLKRFGMIQIQLNYSICPGGNLNGCLSNDRQQY